MDLPVCTRHRQEVTGCAGVLRQTVGRTSLQEPPMSLDAAAYQRLYAQSVDDPDAFWGEAARRLDWMRAPTRVKYTSFDADDFHIRRSEEHTSELQSLMCISYAVFCLKKNKNTTDSTTIRVAKNKIN